MHHYEQGPTAMHRLILAVTFLAPLAAQAQQPQQNQPQLPAECIAPVQAAMQTASQESQQRTADAVLTSYRMAQMQAEIGQLQQQHAADTKVLADAKVAAVKPTLPANTAVAPELHPKVSTPGHK